LVGRRIPKVTKEASEPTEVSDNQQEDQDMAQPFSGGNISEQRLKEITLPSDTATSLLIKRFENFTPVASFDVRQNTNGFGTRAIDAKEEITLEEAQKRLMARVNRDADYIRDFGERYNYNFTDNEVAALNSFIFNLGRGALDQVTDGGTRSKEEIASKMLEYNQAGGEQLEGLVKRRKDERDVFIGEAILGGGD
tara:strand:+ start:2112 stop:2696 length:585 start_codon:yes stop_codon:yes gene_type:complete